MQINGIGMNGMPPPFGGATKTTKAGDEEQARIKEREFYTAFLEKLENL